MPFSPGFPIDNLGEIKIDIDLEARSGNLEVQRAVRYSDDGGLTWGAVVALGAATSSAGKTIGSFSNLDASKQQVQVGLRVRNISGSRVEKALIAANIHLKH